MLIKMLEHKIRLFVNSEDKSKLKPEFLDMLPLEKQIELLHNSLVEAASCKTEINQCLASVRRLYVRNESIPSDLERPKYCP